MNLLYNSNHNNWKKEIGFTFAYFSSLAKWASVPLNSCMFLVLYWEAILSYGFIDLECSENRFLSSALGHLNVSFHIWWWLGLWSFKRFKLHQDEKGKEVHGKWKKVRKWYSFFPLIYLLHQCLQIGLGIGNELRPRSATCVGRAESRVCHPGGAASHRRV